MCFSEKEKGQNTKQSCYRFILCPLLYGASPSLFGNLKHLRIGSVIFFTVGYFQFSSIRSLFDYLFNGAALYVAPRTFLSVNSISVSLHYNSFRSFANSKTLAIIVSKKTRLSSSDNAVMSGVPTVTTSSSVFSTFITSSHLIFWEAEKYPSLFRLENGKKQGAKRKILQIFFARRLYLRFDTWNYTLFFALSVSRWKYTFRSKTDTFRYCKYTNSEKPSIYGYRRYTLALQLKFAAREIRADRQAVQRRTPVPVRFWVSPYSVCPYGGCLNGEAQPSRSFIQAPATVPFVVNSLIFL